MFKTLVLTSDDWQLWRELRRTALADDPAAFGSTLAEWSGAGNTEQRWRARQEDSGSQVVVSVKTATITRGVSFSDAALPTRHHRQTSPRSG
jgi:hypothetical protein